MKKYVIEPGKNTINAVEIHKPAVSPNEIKVRVKAASLNYRDILNLQFSQKAIVPFSDGAGEVVEVGSEVVAIGNSRGDVLEARAGQVTRLGVEASRADFASGTVELTASLAPGDSGGPVLNELGEVIGVVSYISFMPGSDEAFVPPFLRDLGLIREFASYAVPVTRSGDVLARL
ncbi:MAG: trypsin-like peptidase domain-containing protein, partial [Pleurocapsa sp.]